MIKWLAPSTRSFVQESLHATAAGALAHIEIVLRVDGEVVRQREATPEMPWMAYGADDLHVAAPEDPYALVAAVRHEPVPLVGVAGERQVEQRAQGWSVQA